VAFQNFKDREWLVRNKFELADWLKKPKSSEIEYWLWIDENPEGRKEFTFEEHWTKHEKDLRAYQTFREENWPKRQEITFETWRNHLETRKYQQFRETNWETRARFSLADCLDRQK
jgi:hypothetical protein